MHDRWAGACHCVALPICPGPEPLMSESWAFPPDLLPKKFYFKGFAKLRALKLDCRRGRKGIGLYFRYPPARPLSNIPRMVGYLRARADGHRRGDGGHTAQRTARAADASARSRSNSINALNGRRFRGCHERLKNLR